MLGAASGLGIGVGAAASGVPRLLAQLLSLAASLLLSQTF